MRAYARRGGEDEELWGVVGLLHDIDYERYPDLETGHPRVALAELEARDVDPVVVRAIASHADFLGVSRDSPLEKTLFAVDELSGFILACAYVRPEGIHGLTPKSVKKKLKQPELRGGRQPRRGPRRRRGARRGVRRARRLRHRRARGARRRARPPRPRRRQRRISARCRAYSASPASCGCRTSRACSAPRSSRACRSGSTAWRRSSSCAPRPARSRAPGWWRRPSAWASAARPRSSGG